MRDIVRRGAVLVTLASACPGSDPQGGATGSSGGGSDGGGASSTSPGASEDTGADDTTTADATDTGLPATTGGGSTAATGEPTTTGEATTGDETGGEPACPASWPQWDDGTACGTTPSIQIHQVDSHTVILRQSLCTSFEGPFLYLLFGEDRVLLEDTGDGGIPIADTVYGIIDDWLAANGKDSIELVVVNSHAHGDHVQGNSMFAGQPNTTVVGLGVGAVSGYFGIDDWPAQVVQFDLGGRVVDIIPIPGHEASHIAIWDPRTRWLLTGDTLYPGRLYIAEFPTYVASIERLVAHVRDLPVCNVMGTHIEMTNTPGQDFPFGATMHPDEHPLALDLVHLGELRDAVAAMGSPPQIEVHDDFIVYPL